MRFFNTRFGYVLLGLVTLASLSISSGQCSNGLTGVQKGDICCEADCGTCGGSSCGQRPGGTQACCTSRIVDSGDLCSVTSAAPCIIDDEAPVCSNGLPGVEQSSICCEAQCGTCGGAGCSDRPGGSSACCRGNIRDSGDLCSITSAAPCIVDDDPEELCSNGVPGVQNGNICCEAQCETCGGSGCGQRPGGKTGCCTSRIVDTGIFCSITPVAPCIIDDDEDGADDDC